MENEGADDCSVIDIAHMLGKKWTIPIVEEIYSNKEGIHFNGLLNEIGDITVCMLARELNELYADGFLEKTGISINRTTYINYKLTRKGLLLAELIDKAKEFCVTCCPLGEACKYSRRRRGCPFRGGTHATMISESRQYK